MISFPVQKLLRLIRSHLFIFAFIFFALGYRSKKQKTNKTKPIATTYVKECSAYVRYPSCELRQYGENVICQHGKGGCMKIV